MEILVPTHIPDHMLYLHYSAWNSKLSRNATVHRNVPFQCFGCTRPPVHRVYIRFTPHVVLATLLLYTSSGSRFSPKMEVWTQKEAHFSNSGETSTFSQQNSIQKQFQTARCAVRTTKLVNGHFFAILSARPTSATTNSSGLSQLRHDWN